MNIVLRELVWLGFKFQLPVLFLQRQDKSLPYTGQIRVSYVQPYITIIFIVVESKKYLKTIVQYFHV